MATVIYTIPFGTRVFQITESAPVATILGDETIFELADDLITLGAAGPVGSVTKQDLTTYPVTPP